MMLLNCSELSLQTWRSGKVLSLRNARITMGQDRRTELPAVANILVFALWYWKLDAGGPLRRERPLGLMNSSFLFSQMSRREERDQSWTPHFVDYLFLACNTSTAFSPTDTAVLSRRAQLGMMVQSLVSLTIIALLAARAVNIL
jgi:hypothetical protein